MNIKKFIADNTQDALKLVKKEMGSDAVILKTRSIDAAGTTSNTKKKMIEVTAAVDYIAPVVTSSAANYPDNGFKRLEKQIKEIKEAVFSTEAMSALAPEIFFNHDLKDRYMNYRTFGLKSEIIRELMEDSPMKGYNSTKGAAKALQESLLSVLSRIRTTEKKRSEKNCNIFSFIGPTGVGKTTTLAKLAAANAVSQGKKTALITLDTFRIAAVAQLQTYAKIMRIPLEVVIDKEDLRKAIKKHKDCDAIYIDTVGRSPNSEKDISALAEFFKIPEEIHFYLVLSASTRYQNLISTDQSFGRLPVKSYIFTKLDETDDTSTMLNFLISRQKPVSYFTNGQQVPEDIEPASRKRLAAYILGNMKEGKDNSLREGKINGSGYGSQELG